MNSTQDIPQWLTVSEETLFLHDGLLRVSDLVELPPNATIGGDGNQEIINFESNDPNELSTKLQALCASHNNTYTKLLEYRLNAVKGLWKAQLQLILEEEAESAVEDGNSLLKKLVTPKEEQASFSSRLSLLLVLPLIQSQSRLDPSLTGVTAELLLKTLRDCCPHSLSKEPSDCLDGIEQLLCDWLQRHNSLGTDIAPLTHHINVASALVALASARGNPKTFLQTVHLLQNQDSLTTLPVADLLQRLLEIESTQGHPTALLGPRHILCWGFDDTLTTSEPTPEPPPASPTPASLTPTPPPVLEGSRSIATDGKFLYVTGANGKGLVKVGSGLHGTLRAAVYAKNADFSQGMVAYAKGILLHRSADMDAEDCQHIAQAVSPVTLQPVKYIYKPAGMHRHGLGITVNLCSDGRYFYWVVCAPINTEKNIRPLHVYAFTVDGTMEVELLSPPTTIVRKDEASLAKSSSDTSWTRLRPFRSPATASTLVALTGVDIPMPPRKEDIAITSCGLPLKTLLRAPILCDGVNVVLLTPATGGVAAATAGRFTFGTTAAPTVLAINLVFNVVDGLFKTRVEFTDAPSCSLTRGATLQGLGLCYDKRNHCIWSVGQDWVDRFENPANQAPHHVLARLGLTQDALKLRTLDDNNVAVQEIVHQMLRHVATLCIHSLNCDPLPTPSPRAGHILQVPDLPYLRHLCDVLQNAIDNGSTQIIICALIIIQPMLKVSGFNQATQGEIQLINQTRELLWRVTERFGQAVRPSVEFCAQHEACNVLLAGLDVFFQSPVEQYNLLNRLLSEACRVPAFAVLRDKILLSFANALRTRVTDVHLVKHIRLNPGLVQVILKICIKDSCQMIREVLTSDDDQLESILATVPQASASLQYLMALQIHLLRTAVLYNPPSAGAGEEMSCSNTKCTTVETLEEIQGALIGYSARVLTAAYEVLEVLLDVSQSLLTSGRGSACQEALQKLAQASLLGQLLPLMVTALTHPNLRCLPMADTLMSRLVQLVLTTSQVALLLRSPPRPSVSDDGNDPSIDSDLPESIINVSQQEISLGEEREKGFLEGLSIPTPWTMGRLVETIHPVRDNYKFKETVHIPGARCLYMRFDPRCSSQYDYDKLMIYAGANTTNKKVAEFGGNTLGYGSRSVLGSGWPKDLLRVDGDTVTVAFEMRSGREHNTPDRAVWGVAVTVRAQETEDTYTGGLPFLADLALAFTVLGCTLLKLLYDGPVISADEEKCRHLLHSALLQRCVWQSSTQPDDKDFVISAESEADPAGPPSSPPPSPTGYTCAKGLARIRMPNEIVKRLRELGGRSAPQIRQNLRLHLKPEVLEECILSTAAKHLGLCETIHNLTRHEELQTREFFQLRDVMAEIYRRYYALIRQIQVLAELEQKWYGEVDEVQQNLLRKDEVFFLDYHLVEGKMKELAMLSFFKDIPFDEDDLDNVVSELREQFFLEVEIGNPEAVSRGPLLKTQAIIEGIRERINLLLQVTISKSDKTKQNVIDDYNSMAHSDTDVLQYGRIPSRCGSVPLADSGTLDDIVLDSRQSRRPKHSNTAILSDVMDESSSSAQTPHHDLIEQLFAFIGSSPEKAVSVDSFLSAAGTRWRRSRTRQQSLVHMRELLTALGHAGGATHLIAAVTAVIQQGPRTCELTCGGMVQAVQDAFSDTMACLVQQASAFPMSCSNNIAQLCTVPYTRAEEKCLVRSGLVNLLDRLCSLSHQPRAATGEGHVTKQLVATMAWAGFQVLSNRCVSWEQEEEQTGWLDLEHSGLACQVSSLLTNHLSRATEESAGEVASNEALQEILSLLNRLARSRMGRAILSQPGCVSRLLSLLLDQRPTPRLVLLILQLCRVALPLMSSDDCERIELPAWGTDIHQTLKVDTSDRPLAITRLLLAKLGDFLVPGTQTVISSRRPSLDSTTRLMTTTTSCKQSTETDVQDGRLSVYVHKRKEQPCHEIIQALLNSETRSARVVSGGAQNMDKVVKIDKDLTKNGKAEVVTEEAVTAYRKAIRWAQLGLIVSTCPPSETAQNNELNSGKKKANTEVCKEKNTLLARLDPVRPFISGHVANSMAAEVIGLLHSLVTVSETQTATTWAQAVQRVITDSLSYLHTLLAVLEDLPSARASHYQHLMVMAKQVNAALAAIGGFEEGIKAGTKVKIVGENSCCSLGTVTSVSETTGLATVELSPPVPGECAQTPPRFSDTVQAAIGRLKPPTSQPLPLVQLGMTSAVVSALQTLLVPQFGRESPLVAHLPTHGTDAQTLGNQISRVISEIRCRASKVLSLQLQDLGFASAFIQSSGLAINVLKTLAKDCSCQWRLNQLESMVTRLRHVYRDGVKPLSPPSHNSNKPSQDIKLDTCRPYPPIRCCLFTHGQTTVTFLGDSNSGSNLPRGALIYATTAIPPQAPSFYWEVDVISLGEAGDESAPFVSFGFMPAAERKEGTWAQPVGSCLLHNNGRAVHYSGSSLLQWRSQRVDLALKEGDTVGVGWEKSTTTPTPPLPAGTAAPPVKGRVFFTYNGRRLLNAMEDVQAGLWPVVHLQKRNVRIRANFGKRPFVFAAGLEHRNAADDCHPGRQEIKESFGLLPFAQGSDSESESTSAAVVESTTDGGCLPLGACRVATVPKSLKEYSSDNFSGYKLIPAYANLTTTGPDSRTQLANQDTESDIEDKVEDEPGQEDHFTLLVKAWEQKVFPIIRRRFRNEAERKDGLEQIKGALQLGMVDIARQTVEFLYEENGGIPRDLALPTIDDIREELGRFTIERVKKGLVVVIKAATTVPKFAVRSMLKTFGLIGVVLEVDTATELVQVETYLHTEGALVRFWYPLDQLEKPPPGQRKVNRVGPQAVDINSVNIHRELLHRQGQLTRLYCRGALLELINQCNSPAMELTQCASGLAQALVTNAAMLQELDVDNLQLLSDHQLASAQSHGAVTTDSLTTTTSPWHCVTTHACLPSTLFYAHSQVVRRELKVAVTRAGGQGEDYLAELTSQICMCLQTAPELFPVEEFPVTETKVSTDVHFPGAAFLVISCKQDPKAIKKDSSLYKLPWARVYTYTGHRIRKQGHFSKQEIVSYPKDYGTNIQDVFGEQYPSVIVPGNRIHVRFGMSPLPGMIVVVHGLPSQFPLALTYLEVLVSKQSVLSYAAEEVKAGTTSPVESSAKWKSTITITPPVLIQSVDLLSGYLWRSDVPPRIKELVLHLLAQTLRQLRASEGGLMDLAPTISPQHSPTMPLFKSLLTELAKFHEDKAKFVRDPTSVFVRCSTYFHSLMEACLAIAEVTPLHPQNTPPSDKTLTATASDPASSILNRTDILKYKKVKAKRLSPRGSASQGALATVSRPGQVDGSGSGTRLHQSDSSTGVGSSDSSQQIEAASPEPAQPLYQMPDLDMAWFLKSLTTSHVLRHITSKDVCGLGPTMEAIVDAKNALRTSNAHARLLVLSNIPRELSTDTVVHMLRTCSNRVGGLYRGKLFLPLEDGRVVSGAEDVGGASTSGAVAPHKGMAVVELRTRGRVDAMKQSLYTYPALKALSGPEVPVEFLLTASLVSEHLEASSPDGNIALSAYLLSQLLENKAFSGHASRTFTEIFQSVAGVQDSVYLSEEQISDSVPGNLMCRFLKAAKPVKESLTEHVHNLVNNFGVLRSTISSDSLSGSEKLRGKPSRKPSKPSLKDKQYKEKTRSKENVAVATHRSSSQTVVSGPQKPTQQRDTDSDKVLSVEGFLRYAAQRTHLNVRLTWHGLFASGYDLHLDRCVVWASPQAYQQLCSGWSDQLDSALVYHVNSVCRHLGVAPSTLHPHDISIEESQLTSQALAPLQGVPIEMLRLRMALLQSVNNNLLSHLLPWVDLRPALSQDFNLSTAHLLSKARHMMFFHTKMFMLDHILNSTIHRKSDQAAPEVTLDPLEGIGGRKTVQRTSVCQALRQLSTIASTQLCVPLASGGDPTYAFNVKFTGEEVHGTSGSFRHFLFTMARELESSVLDLFIPSPTAACSKHKGKFVLRPGPIMYPEERILQFIGQLLGVTIRANIPLGLDLLPVFWRNLVSTEIRAETDLRDADLLTYNYLNKLEQVKDGSELDGVMDGQMPNFTYSALNGLHTELLPNGSNIAVTWDNRVQYIESIRHLRMTELRCSERIKAVRTGLASIVPLQTLSILTCDDLQMRVCGLPAVNLDFLKLHTLYQVGLTEHDEHIRFFWRVLETFSEDDLVRFIKFACNQERIPQTCPCGTGGKEVAHVPPYPMKIAPPDVLGNPDSRHIRVETCMFMIKLPQYSSEDIMRQKLLYAIHCRDDPLSG